MTGEEEKNRPALVPTSGNELTGPASDLIRRGLQELSSLGPERGVASSSEKIRVLVCDDEDALVEVIATMLEAAGYDVRSTLNSLEAIEIAREFQPRVALIGEIMPRMDGFKLAVELNNFLPRTKIVLTAEAELSDLKTFREKGWPFDILVCPFEKDELLEKTRAWAHEALHPEHPRILVVSPEEAFNEGYTEELTRNGYNATCIGTTRKVYEIVEAAKTFQPDIVILYQDMFLSPQLTGFDLAVLLLAGLPDALFIMCTFEDDLFPISEEAWAYAQSHASRCERYYPLHDELLPKVRAWRANRRPNS